MAETDRIKWNTKYRERAAADCHPAAFLVAASDLLPRRGRALDVAGGSGRHALWLAARGLEVTICDIAEAGLALAEEEAARRGLRLQTCRVDLEQEPLPAAPWDLIVCCYFLWRPLFAVFPTALAPGGQLAFVHPTRSNLRRRPKPGARFLLEDGELPGLVEGLEILRYDEGWTAEDRHEARLVARRRC